MRSEFFGMTAKQIESLRSDAPIAGAERVISYDKANGSDVTGAVVAKRGKDGSVRALHAATGKEAEKLVNAAKAEQIRALKSRTESPFVRDTLDKIAGEVARGRIKAAALRAGRNAQACDDIARLPSQRGPAERDARVYREAARIARDG